MTPSTTDRPFHVGMTAARIVDEAAALTRASHLLGWSIRDLAGALAVSPSVVYHHVGGTDALCRAVADRVIGSLEVPDAAGARWDDWFRALLKSQGPRIAGYPGVAKWMLMHGPTIPSASVILDRGMTLLASAGFGHHAPAAYALLLNTAMTTISTGDDRRQHDDDGPRDHTTMMAEFARLPSSPAARALGDGFIASFAAGGEAAERMRWTYYEFAVDTVIAGLAARLAGIVACAPAPDPARPNSGVTPASPEGPVA